MALKRMDNTLLVVEDLDAAIAFFKKLGMKLEGRMVVEGPWVDKTIGIKNARSEIATMVTPDGHGRIELDKFLSPKARKPKPDISSVNTLGFRRIMFEVDDVEKTLASLKPLGAELVCEVVNYQDVYKLCYIRGPEGILLGLAQALK
ncbi:MAG: glyoxalase [Fibrobacteres bacterium]|nr:glyoxalase [Fibrobacterota bacterium]